MPLSSSEFRILGRALALAAALLLWGTAGAQADPPGRVGRLADTAGTVSMFDAENGAWSSAARNRPITSGDRISAGAESRAELRIGSTVLRLTGPAELEVLRLDDERLQFQLHAGSLGVRVRSRDVAEELEISTPEVRLRPVRAGHYRIDRKDDTTFAGSWRGELWVDDADGLTIASGQRMELWRLRGQGPLQRSWSALPSDTLHMWAMREDAQEERSASSRYVSPEMTGAEDLDRYGRWDRHPEFGPIWIPLSVQIGWAPYQFGQWSRVGPWGWTWVDAAPWGFAPFHYGRWVSWRGQWCWTPGAYSPRPVYAPALVAWVGGAGRLPGSSWVPLTPYDRYVPHFHASPGYHQRFSPLPNRPDRSTMPVPNPPMAVVAPPRHREPDTRNMPGNERGFERGNDRGHDREHDRSRERGSPAARVPLPVQAVAPSVLPAPVQPTPARPRRPMPVDPVAPAQVAVPVPAPTVVAPVVVQRPAPPPQGHARERDRDREPAREEPRARSPESRPGGRERENQR